MLLHQLLVGQRLAEGDPLVEPLAHQVEGALRLAEPAHRVEDPAGAEPLLGDHEALAALAEQVLGRHPDVVVVHLVVAAVGCRAPASSRTIR